MALQSGTLRSRAANLTKLDSQYKSHQTLENRNSLEGRQTVGASPLQPITASAENIAQPIQRPTQSRRNFIPAGPNPLNLVSQTRRNRLNNPNIAKQGFNPILHTDASERSRGEYKTTHQDYGSKENSRPAMTYMKHQANQQSNNIFG